MMFVPLLAEILPENAVSEVSPEIILLVTAAYPPPCLFELALTQ